MSPPTPPVRFRQHGALTVAGLVVFIGALPLATARWYLLPLLLAPLLVAAWAWRCGTDAGPDGLRIRALLGARHIDWVHVAGLAPDGRGRAVALLADGRTVRLPAVAAADLPRLVAASGQPLQPGGPQTADQ